MDIFDLFGDKHLKFKQFWKGIWMDLHDSEDLKDLNAHLVWNLMVKHCTNYTSFAKKSGSNSRYWPHRMNVKEFAMDKFLWHDIAPIVVDRVIASGPKAVVWKEIAPMVMDRILTHSQKPAAKRALRGMSGMIRFEEMVQMIKRQEALLYTSNLVHCEYDAMVNIECRRNKYHRRVQSRNKRNERKQKRSEFRKWNGKEEEKRIQRKMKKYQMSMDYV